MGKASIVEPVHEQKQRDWKLQESTKKHINAVLNRSAWLKGELETKLLKDFCAKEFRKQLIKSIILICNQYS